METNEKIREQIFEIVNNQIKANDPPETSLTYKRLIDMGYNDFEVKQLIGQCISVELFDVMKFGKKYDEKRYIKNLKKLPEEPFEKQEHGNKSHKSPISNLIDSGLLWRMGAE